MAWSMGLLGAAGGAAGAFDLLETTVLTTTTASVTFNSLGSYSDYKHLELRITAKSGDANNQALRIVMNNDTASNYNWHRLEGDGSSVSSSAQANDSKIVAGLIARSTGSGEFSAHSVSILDFSNTNKFKTTRTLSGFFQTADKKIQLSSGAWRSTSAVTSIRVEAFASFVSGSRFSLYGIK